MSRKEILTKAINELIAEQDKEIAEKIAVVKSTSVAAFDKRADTALNDAIKEYTEDYQKKAEALKQEYNTNIKMAQDGTKAAKDKNLQTEVNTIRTTVQIQYASDIDDLTRRKDAIKE